MASAFSDSLLASAFSDSLIASGILETRKGMTMNFYQILVYIKRHKINKIITGTVFKVQTQIPKKMTFGNATSRHANFTTFCRIVTTDVRNESKKFKIDIAKVGYFTEQSVKSRKKLVCNGP